MPLDPISQEYIALSFAIERLFPGFVDAYFGPPELKITALTGETPDVRAVHERVLRLARAVEEGDYPPARRQYLLAQVRAMAMVTRKLGNEEIDYLEEVRACFDIEPVYIPEAELDRAIAELDHVLPGTGDVRERMIAWKAGYVVSIAAAREAIDRIAAESKRRTEAFVDLPPDGGVEFVFVQDKPWSGYNWYLGGYRSRVDINTDLPIHLHELPGLITHEAYPGHHAEHALKEQVLFHERGYGEHTIQLINTPECVISEGIATLAEAMIFPGEEGQHWQATALYPGTGVTGDPERAGRVATARAALRAVGGNAALKLHAQGASEREVIQYLMAYGLRTEQEARQSLKFIAEPLWRPYIFTYHVGRDLLKSWMDRFPEPERLNRFRTLLTEQITPSAIAAQAAKS